MNSSAETRTVTFWQRKPWRSGWVPTWRKSSDCEWWRYPLILLGNWWGWLRYAHDCQDPRIGCSCSGSYRFPHHEFDGAA